MSRRAQNISEKKKMKPDWWLLIATLLLIAVGVIMVFSSSQYFARYQPYNDSYYFLKSQLGNAAVGTVLMVIAYKMNYHIFRKLTYPIYLVLLGLLVFMVASNQIETIGGAQRWMGLFGRNFQPSELAKIALPMVLAKWITDHHRDITSFTKGYVVNILLVGFTAGLIFLQKDLSTAIVVAASGVIVMFCGGVRPIYLGGTAVAGILLVVGAIVAEPYRLERVYAWLDPWSYAGDEGYQTIQSLLALGSGGFTGVGLGSGGSKWFYLPARHTDFIFSVLGEEVGFFGALLVILLLAFVVWRGVMIAVKVKSLYASLLSMGLISAIAVQAIINLGVVTGLVPVTGITLPFISYGGTSLVVSMAMVGMLLNISRYVER